LVASKEAKQLTARMRETHDLCNEYGDVAAESLIETWIDEAERRTWFLFGKPSADAAQPQQRHEQRLGFSAYRSELSGVLPRPEMTAPRPHWLAGWSDSNCGIRWDQNPPVLCGEIPPLWPNWRSRDGSPWSCGVANVQLRQGFRLAL
jgi:hypothetical protein